jgi:hypothetical protein
LFRQSFREAAVRRRLLLYNTGSCEEIGLELSDKDRHIQADFKSKMKPLSDEAPCDGCEERFKVACMVEAKTTGGVRRLTCLGCH